MLGVKRVKRKVAFGLALVLCCVYALTPKGGGEAQSAGGRPLPADIGKTASAAIREDGFEAYLNTHKDAGRPDREIVVQAESFASVSGMRAEVQEDFAGSPGQSVKTGEEGYIEWEVEVPETGWYHLGIRYYPVEGKSSSIEREIRLDGELPFAGAAAIVLPRVWTNEKDRIERDNRGNDLRPRQVEAPAWQETVLKDMEGYYVEPYSFYFGQGRHTIRLVSVREPMVIDWIKLYQEPESPAYDEIKQDYTARGYREAKDFLTKVQGEAAVWKSSPTLYPISDRASPATEPYHLSKIRMNTIGGYNWRMPGQTIAWDVEVPEDGLYRIAFKYRQNQLRGIFSTRKVWIDGKIPFRELEKVPFAYSGNFKMKVLGEGEEPYLFHLTKGRHEIKMEVTLGDVAPLLRGVEASVLELNRIYRKILMVTGATPDLFRDYRLEDQIPELLEVFNRQSESLYAIAGALEQAAGGKSDRAAVLNTMAYQLKDLAAKPESLPRRLDNFKINIGALGTWILQVREQPLEIDYLIVSSPDSELPKADSAFLRKAGHELGAFYSSFFEDYNSIGNVSGDGDAVTVWIGTGRDQAQVLKAMIDDTFTPKTGIDVNLKLVQMDILLPATLAGQGPDVAMQIGNDIPVNYAMRNAVQDLTGFPDFGDVAKRFRESAMVPYRYSDGVYALPEQQVFNMLFYRKDILEELNLETPRTWEDVKAMIPVLQKHHMEFGLPLVQNTTGVGLVPNSTFAMLLYQNGGSFYKDGGKTSDLDSPVAMDTFKRWTEFYTHYKFPQFFDFASRFRTGEMPVGIAEYTFYNYLTVSAPEIRGLWAFVPVPATVAQDGSVRRDVGSSGSAAVIMKQTKNKDDAWQFLKWWTDKDTQVRFGREMEGLMGAAARYPTANVEALEELPWPIADYRNLQDQWQWVRGIPEVPGGYFTGRHLDNAFREVVNNGTNTREALLDYVRYINDEIAVKRREFNLPE